MLFEVIAVAQHDLVYFFVIILVIFLTFICTFQVAFGANHLAFSTQMKCFLSPSPLSNQHERDKIKQVFPMITNKLEFQTPLMGTIDGD